MNAEDKFLSPEWLEHNLTAAEMMPPDHKIELTTEEWWAVLAAGSPDQKHEVPGDTWRKLLLEIKAKRVKAERAAWIDPGVAHAAINGGLKPEEIIRIYGDEKNWVGIYPNPDDGLPKAKYWAWKGPVIPPWELATWGKKKS